MVIPYWFQVSPKPFRMTCFHRYLPGFAGSADPIGLPEFEAGHEVDRRSVQVIVKDRQVVNLGIISAETGQTYGNPVLRSRIRGLEDDRSRTRTGNLTGVDGCRNVQLPIPFRYRPDVVGLPDET